MYSCNNVKILDSNSLFGHFNMLKLNNILFFMVITLYKN